MLALTACTGNTIKNETHSLPTSFCADVTAEYDGMSIAAEVQYDSPDKIKLVFTSPETFTVTVSGEIYTIENGSSLNEINEKMLPDNGFLKIIASLLKYGFGNDTDEHGSDGEYYVYGVKTPICQGLLYINTKSGLPEKLTAPDINFYAEFKETAK